jgi:KUP system potassium uptake protein
MGTQSHHGHHPLSKAGLLITLGIIFGDIGTSPLYVMKAIVGEGEIIDRLTVLGGRFAGFLDADLADNH